MNSQRTVAAFDFDGTLTWCDSLPLFFLYIAGPLGFIKRALPLLPTLIAYKMGLTPYEKTKQRALRAFLAGCDQIRAEQKAAAFAQAILPKLLRKKAYARLLYHHQQGHTCVIVSASLELYLAPWAKHARIDHVIGSRLELDSTGALTGSLQGANCAGEEKCRRLLAFLGKRGDTVLYAYGNSPDDRPMLKMADHAFYRMRPYAA